MTLDENLKGSGPAGVGALRKEMIHLRPMVEVRKLPPVRVAYVVREGDYDRAIDVFRELCAWVETNGLRVGGPPVLVYWSNPEGVPPCFRKWELQLPVAGKAAGGIQGVKELPEREVVVTLSRGGYTTVGALLPALFQVVYDLGYRLAGPAEEVYPLNFPEVPVTELVTEVRLPVLPR